MSGGDSDPDDQIRLPLSYASVFERGDDVGHLGAGGVVGLDVDEAHDAILIDDEHGGSGQADGALGVDLGQVETELALGGEDVVGLLERDADPIGQTSARVGEDGELQGGLFHGGERLVR